MIVSHSRRFIFIHIPKNAGMAVDKALGQYDEKAERLPLSRLARRFGVARSPQTAFLKRHDPARAVVRLIGAEAFARYTSFAVVRNPFDHAVSHYEYMKQLKTPYGKAIREMSFADYLSYRADTRRVLGQNMGKNLWFAKLPNQSWFVDDAAGQRLVTHILRFETLADDLADLAQTLGLEFAGLERTNQSVNRARDVALGAYYQADEADLVRVIYGPDFKAFGYDSTAF
ncbi:hypothetical protein E4Z66_03235 [Aliishimia ponticola]|uniref:Sulfotransferase family protein n=1 Tax=Aliishimia ponticola TaxID=2499833 RepID=A0A4S4NIN8_9RHOB|nr:sulfotransferase family 2 domain-containing protein [Aliishimia ponticola]THH38597.1 hypothetical protein E4Z66_03235 [Aliishimia ponticola]